ncbi:MAG TPA: DUF4157 domain-containing protein [Candidatus Angelobacter sp.]|nr:DUF4157 domain-containing protein [Candidatus Angelobacter sp.]
MSTASTSSADNLPISTANSGGQPLAPAVRMALEESYQVDMGGVRVHSDSGSQEAAAGLSARAFAYGNNIVLGRGESSTDLGLMAHEGAHVVQQQAAPIIQRYTPGGDSYELEAHQASAAVVRGETFQVQQRTQPRVQRLGLSDIRDYIADKANIIPGFRMFTIVLGVNPINGADVDRSPANVLRAIIEFIPFGGLITQALDNYGIFDKIGNWVAQQIKSLGMIGSSFAQAISDFIHSLGVSDFLHPGDTWERAKAIFTGPIDQLINFAKGLFDGIVQFIKDAILKPLAALAEGTPGWALLTAVLGKNPITGEAVPQTAENLIGPFMTLIGQEEIWENIKKANALARCWAWFKGALAGLLSFVEQIPSLFMSTLRSLEIMDIVVLPRAFIKVGTAFGGFLVKFVSWAGDTIWDLLKIIFEVVAPGAMPYLQKVGGALKKIFKDPISFVGNLVKAGKLGFQNFASNIGTHLKRAFLEWLTGSLPGIYIPKALSLKEFALLALSVLGITWANIRQKLVKATSENIVKGLEAGFAIVKKLVTEGPAAAWEEIKSQLSNLKDMVMEGIMNFIIETVVKKAVAKVLSLLVPGGAFIQAIISIYDTIMVFIAKLKKIIQVAMAFLDSMMAIANGVIGAAAAKVESVLAGLLVLAISFLAGFLGLNKIADKVMNIINTKVRAPVDKAIDFVINWIVTTAKNLFKALFGKKDAKPDERTDAQKQADLDKAIAEADALQKKPKITEDKIKKGLLAIKTKYKMASLELAVDSKTESQETVHIEGAINPTKKTGTATLAPDKPAQQAHDEVMAKMSAGNKSLLKGHGAFISGHAGRGFSDATYNALDPIGYASGDHSNPSIKDPGTKGRPSTDSGKAGKGNWIPDHQPPDTLAGGGASLSFRFYPHSQTSARAQGGAVRVYKMWMKEARNRGDSDWSEGVQSDWFW